MSPEAEVLDQAVLAVGAGHGRVAAEEELRPAVVVAVVEAVVAMVAVAAVAGNRPVSSR